MEKNEKEEKSLEKAESKMKWAVEKKGESSTCDYQSLLLHAKDLYIQQTRWFLHHEQVTIRNLATLLTAEFAITGSIFTVAKESLPYAIIACIALIILAYLSQTLATYGIKSCRKAYMASLEYAMMKSKIAWLMGITTPITVNSLNFQACPAPDDGSLYIPRHLNAENANYNTTNNYVKEILARDDNTYYHSKKKIGFFKTLGILLGLGSTILIILAKFITLI